MQLLIYIYIYIYINIIYIYLFIYLCCFCVYIYIYTVHTPYVWTNRTHVLLVMCVCNVQDVHRRPDEVAKAMPQHFW
jgi:hypothetical protein